MGFAMLCPGQSTQKSDMLEIVTGYVEADGILEAFQDITGLSVASALATPERMFENRIAQPLLAAVGLASHAVLQPDLPTPDLLAGYSIGELVAYGCAGSLTPREVIWLAARRGGAMDLAYNGATEMISVKGLREELVSKLCAQMNSFVAIRNGEDHFVITGPAVSVRALFEKLADHGGQVRELFVGVASHTPLMQSAIAPFQEALGEVNFRDPKVPVLAGIDGSPVTSASAAIEKLCDQLVTRIDWLTCMEMLRERGCSVVLELPPGSSLTRMLQAQEPDIASRSVADFRTVAGVAQWTNSRIL